jgi:hypothetical protein
MGGRSESSRLLLLTDDLADTDAIDEEPKKKLPKSMFSALIMDLLWLIYLKAA